MDEGIQEQLERIEERQEALMEAIGTMLEWEYDHPRQFFDQHLMKKKRDAEELHRKLKDVFYGTQTGRMKKCDICEGKGYHYHYDHSTGENNIIKCESCDGKGKYIEYESIQ